MKGILIIIFAMLACVHTQVAFADNLTRRNGIPNVVEYMLNCFVEEQNGKDIVMVEKIFDYDECLQIEKLGFLFDTYKSLTLPQARQLVTGLVNDLLKRINSNEKIKDYLANTPFTTQDVVIRLRMRNKDCGFIYPALGNIAYVSAIDGSIIYDTINSFTYDLDTLRTESFADALKILSSPSAH